MNLEALTKTAESLRDHMWEEKFFKALSESNLKLMSPDPVQGPDSWPYMMVQTDFDNGQPEQTVDSAQKILSWLSTKGIGLVVNPQKDYPDYVFTYGMIWSFRETGYFRRLEQLEKNGQFEFDATATKLGSPSQQYFPLYVRKIIREFFRDQGLLAPKVMAAVNSDGTSQLIFSMESVGSPKENEREGVAEAISWFLPPHYNVVLLSEKAISGFEPL